MFVSEGTYACEKCGEIDYILLKNEKPNIKKTLQINQDIHIKESIILMNG